MGRRLAPAPRLLMLDEPSMGLAPAIADEIFDRIVTIRRETHLSVLRVEQRVAEALRFADRGYVLETGRVILDQAL
jgi:branched-chain amino acid transport system ATP-binding protein